MFNQIKFTRLIVFGVVFFMCGTMVANTTGPNTQRPKVGLVLSGGGAKGYAYIGLLKVLHEVNMPIDYIGGSSIGAIVGGMYAIGYHPDTIEQIVRSQNWNHIINNHLDRKFKAYEEKQFTERSVFSIPIDSNKVSIGSSLTGSLNVDLMLNRIFSPAFAITDFNKLDIPFLCIGTDLITGEAVLLNSGSLPKAIRASMSIPGYFPPALYNDRYYIDGGVVNNYPAEQVKQMGADIIIGGDVQSKEIASIDKLNTIPKILNHIIGYQRVSANKAGRSITDYYVRFEMDYSMMDFTLYDSIIALGYRVAMKHYDELKSLADSLNNIESVKPRNLKTQALDKIYVNNIVIDGDEELNAKIARGYFDETQNKNITIAEIERSIKYIKGTNSFKEINYDLINEGDKNMLQLSFQKASQGELGLGVNINSDYEVNFLLNFAFRNLWNTRAKLFADVVLGQSPRFYGLFLINNGLKPGFGFDVDYFRFGLTNYVEGLKGNDWDFHNFSTSVFMPLVLKNELMFKLGAKYEYFRFDMEQRISEDSVYEGEFKHFGQAFASIESDNRNKYTFPTKGGVFELKAKYVVPVKELFGSEASHNFYTYLKFDQNIPVFNKMVFKPGVFAGYSAPSKVLAHKHIFGLGGQSSFSYVEGLVPFTGFRFVEKMGLYSGVLRLHFEYNVYDKFYLSLMNDFGFNESEWSKPTVDDLLFGYGIKLSYDSFIGPVSFSVMQSNVYNDVSYAINIGYPLK